MNLGVVMGVVGRRTMSATEIAGVLMLEHRMSESAAFRAVERAVAEHGLASSAPVSFSEGRLYLYWDPRRFDQSQHMRAILEHLKKRPSMHTLIHALMVHRGMLPRSLARRFTTATSIPIARHATYATLLDHLKRLDLIHVNSGHPFFGEVISLNNRLMVGIQPAPLFSQPARIRADSLVIDVVAKWLQLTSLVAWGKIDVRSRVDGRPVDFNGFAFDLKAPCYLSAMTRWDEVQDRRVPGWFLADVTSGKMDEVMAANLVRKIDAVRSRARAPAIFGACFAGSFSAEAIRELRHAGIMVVALQKLGSTNLVTIIKAMAVVHAAALAVPEKVDYAKALRSLVDLADRRDGNLAGRLFELMIARHLQHDNWIVERINHQFRVLDDTQAEHRGEIDVLAYRSNDRSRFHLASCKGYNAHQPVREDEVKEWFGDRMVWARRHLAERNAVRHATVSFFTSSKFDDDAIAYLQRVKEQHARSRTVTIEYHDGVSLKEAWTTSGLTDLVGTLAQFYGKPIAATYNPITGEMKEARIASPELGLREDPPKPKEMAPAHEPDEEALEAIVMDHDPRELLKIVEATGPSLDAKPPEQLTIE